MFRRNNTGFFLDWWNAFAWGLYSVNHSALIWNGDGELFDYCGGFVLIIMNHGLSMSSHFRNLCYSLEHVCFGKVVAIWYYVFR